MPAAHEFSEKELKLIVAVKRTLKILAKVIEDRNPGEVIKDIDPKKVVEDELIADTIIKTNFLQRIKDFDPDSENENNDLAILVDELITEIKKEDPTREVKEQEIIDIINKLARAIQAKVTPDIPGLNPKDEGVMIGRLGPHIFASLIRTPRKEARS